MTRFLGYGLFGFMFAGAGYFVGLSVLSIVIGLCSAFTALTLIKWVTS